MTGHYARDCPNPRQFKGNCYNCGGYGHAAANCPSSKGAGKGGEGKGAANGLGEEGGAAGERQLGGIDFGG